MRERVVLVGATSGMGLAAAQSLQLAGYEVVVTGRTGESADAAATMVGTGARGGVIDYARPETIGGFFSSLDRLDHLVLIGSGEAAWGPFAQLTLEALRKAFTQKFEGYVLAAQAALPKIRKDGSFTFVIGGASRSAIPGTSGVAAVNGAIQALAFTLAKELAPLRVNILSPGLVDTPAYGWMSEEQKADFFKQMGGQLPVGRVGRPEEVAEAVLYLVRNTFTTGAILDVDGGGRLH